MRRQLHKWRRCESRIGRWPWRTPGAEDWLLARSSPNFVNTVYRSLRPAALIPLLTSLRAKLTHAFGLLRTYQHKVRVLDATLEATGGSSCTRSRPTTPAYCCWLEGYTADDDCCSARPPVPHTAALSTIAEGVWEGSTPRSIERDSSAHETVGAARSQQPQLAGLQLLAQALAEAQAEVLGRHQHQQPEPLPAASASIPSTCMSPTQEQPSLQPTGGSSYGDGHGVAEPAASSCMGAGNGSSHGWPVLGAWQPCSLSAFLLHPDINFDPSLMELVEEVEQLGAAGKWAGRHDGCNMQPCSSSGSDMRSLALGLFEENDLLALVSEQEQKL